MERKLIKQGAGGYTIYLPKKWVAHKGLAAGNQISITESGSRLVLDSKYHDRKETTLALTTESQHDIKNLLTHIYRDGFDTITITGADAKKTEHVQRVTDDYLLGFEMTKKDANSCTLENVSEPSEEKYDVLLRRIFLIIKETHASVLSSLESGKYNQKEIDEFRRQQEEFILFCRRVLVRGLHDQHVVLHWELLTFLMHIEHTYHRLATYACTNGVKASPGTLGLLREAREYFELFYDGFYKKDITNIHRINKLSQEYQFGRCYTAIEKSKGHETVTLVHIREIYRLIQIGTSPVLAMLLEETFVTSPSAQEAP